MDGGGGSDGARRREWDLDSAAGTCEWRMCVVVGRRRGGLQLMVMPRVYNFIYRFLSHN